VRRRLPWRVDFAASRSCYSDQYDLSMEFTGTARSSDRLVVRGSLEERTFVAFWLSDGRVTGGMNANVAKVAKGIERLIRSRTVVDEQALADPSVPLEELTELERAA
jgi:3-phenylpropionate/trans-cinnamate dioxygenase ferredoxin reductase component